MSDSNSNSGGGGIGIAGVAIVVLVTLKLAGVAPVAGWSWFFIIFAPIGIALAFWIVVFGVIGGVMGTVAAGAGLAGWWGRRRLLKMMEKIDEEEEKEEGK